MKRKTLVILGAIIAVLALALVALQTQAVSAKNTTLKEMLFPKNPAPQVAQATATISVEKPTKTPTVFPEGMHNPPTRVGLWVMISSEQKEKNEAVLAIARPLLDQANKAYLTPGWVHIQSQTENFYSLSSTMPDGSPMPTKWEDETWTLVNEHGRAVQSVSIQDTGDEKTSQIGTFQNGIWRNLTLDTTDESAEKTYPISLDSGFLEYIERNKNIVELEYATDSIGTESFAVFTVTSRNNTPVEIGKSGHLVAGSVKKYYFLVSTGLLMKIENYDISPDGRYELTNRITVNVIEKIDSIPSDISKYLK
jgi:hypothetical protein